jgi:hypothetical protein
MEWHLFTEEDYAQIKARALSGEHLDRWGDNPLDGAALAYRAALSIDPAAGSTSPDQARADRLERIARDAEYAALVEARESGAEPIPTLEALPLIDPDDSRLLGSAMGPVPDSFTARNHEVSARTGLVTRRGRATVSGSMSGERSHPTRGDLYDDIRYRGLDIDVSSLPRDARGRIDSLALERLATRLYDLPALVGTDCISWEQIIDANGSDVAALLVTPAVLVSHRNASDPFAAYVDLVGRERLEWNKTLPDIDAEMLEALEDMCEHSVIRSAPVERFRARVRLPIGYRRTGDPEGTERALVAPHDRVVIRRSLSSVRALAAGEPDRVVVGTVPAAYVWVGHRLVARPLTKRAARLAQNRKRRAARAATLERITLHALQSRVEKLERGESVALEVDGFTVRISRSKSGHYAIRGKTPAGHTFKR